MAQNIQDVMTANPFLVSTETPVAEAARLMRHAETDSIATAATIASADAARLSAILQQALRNRRPIEAHLFGGCILW